MKTHLLRVWLVLCLSNWLIACATETVVSEPVVVEVERTVFVPVPDNLLLQHQKTTIPESMTYGEALQLWAEDRGIIDTLLGQLLGIKSLSDSE
jgi:hypothetical protein